jgi:hypothetical protein
MLDDNFSTNKYLSVPITFKSKKMSTYKFRNSKQNNFTFNLITVSTAVIATTILLSVDMKINKYVLYLVFSVIGFIHTMRLIKTAGGKFEKIIIENDKIKLYFFNKMKKPIIISKNELIISVTEEEILFKNSETDLPIGKVLKLDIIDNSMWNPLLTQLG